MDFDLERFVRAQSGAYDDALAELTSGRKRSHWMWFVFPQLRGLGHSETAHHFGISGLAEATAYLAHPVLGPRLRACTEALLDLPGSDAVPVLGHTDALKLRSSMTLFAVASGDPLFDAVLTKYYDGARDSGTTDLLA